MINLIQSNTHHLLSDRRKNGYVHIRLSIDELKDLNGGIHIHYHCENNIHHHVKNDKKPDKDNP